MAKPQEIAFQKCRCFGGPISLVHFSGKAFTFVSRVRLEGWVMPVCLVSFGQTAGLGLQRAVLLVVHGFEPLVACVLAGETECQVTKPTIGSGAMPVLDVGGNLGDIAGVQALRGLALFLVPALAVDADQHLSAALACVVDMPVVAAARLKGDVVDGQVIVRGGQI